MVPAQVRERALFTPSALAAAPPAVLTMLVMVHPAGSTSSRLRESSRPAPRFTRRTVTSTGSPGTKNWPLNRPPIARVKSTRTGCGPGPAPMKAAISAAVIRPSRLASRAANTGAGREKRAVISS